MTTATLNEAELKLSSATRIALENSNELNSCCKEMRTEIARSREKWQELEASKNDTNREIAKIRREADAKIKPLVERRSGLEFEMNNVQREIQQSERGVIELRKAQVTSEDRREMAQLDREIAGLRERQNGIAGSVMVNVKPKDRHAESDNPAVKEAFANIEAIKRTIGEKQTAIGYFQRGDGEWYRQLQKLRTSVVRRERRFDKGRIDAADVDAEREFDVEERFEIAFIERRLKRRLL